MNEMKIMKIYALFGLLQVLSQGSASADSVPTPSFHDEISLKGTPSNLHKGLTKNLHINCSFTPQQGSHFGAVISLIVSKTSPGLDTGFQEIAVVSAFAPNKVDVKNGPLQAQVNGHLSKNGESFISFDWDYPNQEVSGLYKCTANGFDISGHPLATSATSEITYDKDLDVDRLLQKIRDLDLTQDMFNKQISALNNHILNQDKVLKDYKAELEDMRLYKSEMSTRLKNSRDAMMFKTSFYGGHSYLLSKPMPMNVAIADSLCHFYGGHIVEINDVDEYNFVIDFVYNKSGMTGSGVDRVLLGITEEEGHPGKWKYLSNNTSAFLKWRPGEPNPGSEEPCVYLQTKLGMGDNVCYTSDALRRFLCEVP